VDGFWRKRVVAVSLLVAVLAVFGLAAAANAHPADAEDEHGAVVLAVAAPPAHGVAQPPNAPDLPLADAEPTPPRDDQPAVATRHETSAPPAPRAHRQPAADRAPPA
jgi:hypothetical protein